MGLLSKIYGWTGHRDKDELVKSVMSRLGYEVKPAKRTKKPGKKPPADNSAARRKAERAARRETRAKALKEEERLRFKERHFSSVANIVVHNFSRPDGTTDKPAVDKLMPKYFSGYRKACEFHRYALDLTREQYEAVLWKFIADRRTKGRKTT